MKLKIIMKKLKIGMMGISLAAWKCIVLGMS